MYNNNVWQDRRRFQRLSMNLCVNYRVIKPFDLRMKMGDKEIEAEMIDISAGGMALVTQQPIPPNSVLHLKFSLFKLDKSQGSAQFYKPFEIKGQVRSSVRTEKGTHRLGICFQPYSAEVTQDMRAIANTVTLN